MKAIICTKYGSPEVLQLQEVEKPFPKDNEVLIKIRATTAHIGDTKVRRLEPGLGPITDFLFKPLMRVLLGFNGPRNKILGMELAGIVDVAIVFKHEELFVAGGQAKQFELFGIFGNGQVSISLFLQKLPHHIVGRMQARARKDGLVFVAITGTAHVI